MSDTQNTNGGGIPTDWRERLRQMGKDAFQLEEMRRLGFWPPEGEGDTLREAEAELKRLDREMAPLRDELRRMEAEIAKAADVQTALDEIRRKRIERVRAERARKKEERAQAREAHRKTDQQRRRTAPPFLGHGVSGGLKFEGGDNDKLRAAGLPVLSDAAQVAQAMGIEAGQLSWLCYHRGAAFIDHYHHFTIPKKNGGTRVISSPKSRLRAAQSWLLENVLAPLPVHEAAVAFRPGVSTLDNALRHAGRRIVMRVDLKEFFPSIRFGRVKKLFQNLGYNPGVATLFALLCTEAPRVQLTLDEGQKRHVAVGERCLPQGACTSPAMTNLLCRKLDQRLTGAANNYGFTYTRYADDLVFSSEVKDAPHTKLLMLARRILEDEKFVVNDDKTLVMRPQRRQSVTGIVVNAQGQNGQSQPPRLSRSDARRFRAFLHGCKTQGREAMTEKLGQDAFAYASGYFSYIHMVNPQQAAKIRAAHPWLAQSSAPDEKP